MTQAVFLQVIFLSELSMVSTRVLGVMLNSTLFKKKKVKKQEERDDYFRGYDKRVELVTQVQQCCY